MCGVAQCERDPNEPAAKHQCLVPYRTVTACVVTFPLPRKWATAPLRASVVLCNVFQFSGRPRLKARRRPGRLERLCRFASQAQQWAAAKLVPVVARSYGWQGSKNHPSPSCV